VSLIAGLVLLLGGGECLVRGAGSVALRFGLSQLVVGIVIVGLGTSVPELVASIQAALAGAPGLAMGNVVGSNVANILLILGVGAVVYPVICSSEAVYRDGVTMVATATLLGIAVIGGVLNLAAGLLFVLLLFSYVGYLLYSDRRKNGSTVVSSEMEEAVSEPSGSVWLDVVLVVGGIAGVVLGGKLLVTGAISVARELNISDEAIGLTLVAIGTSLPELVTSVIAALRKHTDIALGNVLGSNVYNILGIAGITAIIKPIPVSDHMLYVEIPVMIAVSIILFLLAVLVRRFGRRVGFAFLAGYGAFIYGVVA
jgi:cation:H+ antiporter